MRLPVEGKNRMKVFLDEEYRLKNDNSTIFFIDCTVIENRTFQLFKISRSLSLQKYKVSRLVHKVYSLR